MSDWHQFGVSYCRTAQFTLWRVTVTWVIAKKVRGIILGRGMSRQVAFHIASESPTKLAAQQRRSAVGAHLDGPIPVRVDSFQHQSAL
jgi:hypothetical protein